jgi:hypothetical protein
VITSRPRAREPVSLSEPPAGVLCRGPIGIDCAERRCRTTSVVSRRRPPAHPHCRSAVS